MWYTTAGMVYAAANLIAFALYGIDKSFAIRNKRRIPEKTLIASAVFGAPGALLGMLTFHHKTRKPKFFLTVPGLVVLHAAAAWALWKYLGC